MNISGRKATCSCGKIKDSSEGLAFFEFRGEGSKQATESCKNCGYYECAHNSEYVRKNNVSRKTVVEDGLCTGFVPHGSWEFDTFYCGCSGWD
jgi:hypothetical protein